jgi:hypothetical protein
MLTTNPLHHEEGVGNYSLSTVEKITEEGVNYSSIERDQKGTSSAMNQLMKRLNRRKVSRKARAAKASSE